MARKRDAAAETPAPDASSAPPSSAPAATNLADLIGSATKNDASTGAAESALDDLASRRTDDRPSGDTSAGSGAPNATGGRDYAAEYARRRDGTTRTRRGRPPASEATELAESGDVKPGSKRALALRVEELERENARLVAVTDTGAVDRLSKSVEVLAVLLFSIPAEVRGPHWALSADEARQIGTTTGHAAAPYADKIEAQLPWVAPTVAILSAVGKRVMIDMKLREQEAARLVGSA